MDPSLFDGIDQFYRKRRAKLLISGRHQRTTQSGYWAASEPRQVFELFRKIELGRFKRFVDLGSGDGIVVAVASLFTAAEGIESDAQLHKQAVEMQKRLGLSYSLKNADYLDIDLSAYDVIFISPDNHFHRLEKKLVEESKGTLIIAENMFRPLTLVPERRLSVSGADYSVHLLH